MDYWPAIIEWLFWLLPYALVCIVAVMAWPRIIGLRGEEVRSLSVFSLVFVLGFSLRRFDENRMPWEDQMWLLAITALLFLSLISWGAQKAKIKFAEFEAEFGRKSRADPDAKGQGLIDDAPHDHNSPHSNFGNGATIEEAPES